MLTLEQVRAVNDGLKSGDLHAALRPLEETIDLRHAELPRLEKSALAALKTGLQTPENAQFWAEMVFHPNVSVRRFVRKTMLGLKREAAPIAAPLQKRLEQFWAQETALPDSIKPREAALRREQQEIVSSAVEILLRADPEIFMAFYANVLDAQPLLKDQTQKWEGWQKKQAAYSKAVKEKNDALIRAEWGEEYLDWDKRSQLPWRIWRELAERVQSDAEVQKLLADLGENPWQRASQQWHPELFFQSAMHLVFLPDATGPQKEIAAVLRPYFWRWIEAAFDDNSTEESRKRVVRRANRALHSYQLSAQLGRDELWQRVPVLLQKSKTSLLSEITAVYRVNNFSSGATHGALWNQLAMGLSQSCYRPYNLKEGEWSVPEQITPDLLRGLKIDFKDNYLSSLLESAAKHLETERAKENAAPEIIRPPLPVFMPEDDIALHFDWTEFARERDALGIQDYQAYVKQKTDEIRRETEAIENPDEQSAKLIEPSSRSGHILLSRLPYWRIWKRQMGGTALKNLLWPRVGPALWARYEEKLEAYRRVETDDPAPKLEEKLTASELKIWKTEQRRRQRQLIQNELEDISTLLREVEGFETETRLLKLLHRPGVKEVANANATTLLQQLGSIGFYVHPVAKEQGRDEKWLRENFFLEQKWAPFIEQFEEQLLGSKQTHQWQRASHLMLLSVAYYRLNTPQSRAKFRELLAQMENVPHGLSGPVVALGDIETWLLLVEKLRWPDPNLKELWTRTRQNLESDDARRLTTQVLQLAATTSRERAAKFMLEMLDEVPIAELEAHIETIVSALESPLIAIKRWALKTLPQLLTNYDEASAASLVGEMLWNENGALVKDAAKFLGAQGGEADSVAWQALQDATSLENQAILEAVFRALANLKKRDKALSLNENAQEKLAALCELSPDRFEKFQKKLIG